MAAAQSERRLNWLRDMVSSYGAGLEGSLEPGPRRAITGAVFQRTHDTRWQPARYKTAPHEFVNKIGRNPRR
jgi:hypothetical protein